MRKPVFVLMHHSGSTKMPIASKVTDLDKFQEIHTGIKKVL